MIAGDWGQLPFSDQSFDAVIGDGSLNVYEGPRGWFFIESRRVIRTGGKLVLRVFVAPDQPESLEAVIAEKGRGCFHSFKWRVAQALAKPYVAVKDIYRTIKPVWDHPTLGVYKDSPAIYYFPRLTDLPAPDQIHYAGGYELAERCPVITWTF